jgi:hypothetical protein
MARWAACDHRILMACKLQSMSSDSLSAGDLRIFYQEQGCEQDLD